MISIVFFFFRFPIPFARVWNGWTESEGKKKLLSRFKHSLFGTDWIESSSGSECMKRSVYVVAVLFSPPYQEQGLLFELHSWKLYSQTNDGECQQIAYIIIQYFFVLFIRIVWPVIWFQKQIYTYGISLILLRRSMMFMGGVEGKFRRSFYYVRAENNSNKKEEKQQTFYRLWGSFSSVWTRVAANISMYTIFA